MTDSKPNPSELAPRMPIELTAPSIQRLARKGLNQPLDADERKELCECVVFHIDIELEKRRIPKALRRIG